MHAERFDAMVTFAGCDKSLPGMLMAAARCNVPSVFMYGGSILPGNHNGRVPRHHLGLRSGGRARHGSDRRRGARRHRACACPTIGACAGMFTANTMASVGEAIGMSLPGSASAPAVDRRRDDYAFASGTAVLNLLRQNIRPRHILTKAAFENAIAVVMALGGSTNAVLHLLAIAHEARVELHLDDFNQVAARVPHLADTKPHGRYHMVDIDRIGGVPVVMRELLEAGLLHGDGLTVTGRTIAENLAMIDPPGPDGDVVHPLSDPIHDRRRHRQCCTARWPRRDPSSRSPASTSTASRARPGCSTARTAAMEAILGRSHRARETVLVIRYEGPKGGPGMREMLADHRCHEGRRPGRRLRADHRRSLLRRHPRLLHRSRRTGGGRRWPHRLRRGRRPHPSSTCGPTSIDLLVDAETLAARRENWKLPEPRYTSGVLAKYAVLAQGAEKGAITLP